MKAIILPVCFLGLLTVASADDLKGQITAMNGVVQKAMLKRDAVAFAAALKGQVTPDFKYFEDAKAKPMTFDQMVANMKMGFAQMASISTAEANVLTAKETGNTAKAVVSHHMLGKVAGQDKKTHTMTFSGVSIDMYQKIGGTWKMASMTWRSQETRLDGHLQKRPGM